MEVSVISISAGIYFLPGQSVCRVTSHHFSAGQFRANWLNSPSLLHSLSHPERQRWAIVGWHHTSHASRLHFDTHTHTVFHFQFTHENRWTHCDTERNRQACIIAQAHFVFNLQVNMCELYIKRLASWGQWPLEESFFFFFFTNISGWSAAKEQGTDRGGDT